MSSTPSRLAWVLAVAACAATLVSCSSSGGGNDACQGGGCAQALVDRTPPTVTSLTPADGSTNVWARDPIVVTFSEPIDPASVTVDTFVLADEFGSPVDHVAALSLDGKTLTVRTVGLPAVPNVLHAAVGRVRDRAGNTLASWPVQWSWELPDWQGLGNPVYQFYKYQNTARISVDGWGNPTLVAASISGPSMGALRWSGSAWNAIPLPSAWLAVYEFGVDGDADGRLALAFTRRDSPPIVYGSVWNGSAWSDSTVLSIDTTVWSSGPAVRLGPHGTAVAAWSEGGTAGGIQIKRWDGTTWNRLGDQPLGTGGAPDVSFDVDGSPRVTWSSGQTVYTAGWSDAIGAWQRSSTWAFPGSSPFLARATPAGELYAVEVDQTLSPPPLVVYRYLALADYWVRMDGALNATPDQTPVNPDLAFDPAGLPVVAWAEGNGVFVARWDADLERWEALGSDLDDRLDLGNQRNPDVAVGPGGQVEVVWEATPRTATGYEHLFQAKRYNR